ncbi:MAG: hypothetical protein WCP06_12500 [Verrucomicrobiota bacterium]
MNGLALDQLIEASTEFVCEQWGQGEAALTLYAPVTRIDGTTWVHPAWAREATLTEMKKRATRIWKVRGSLWNPQEYVLVWARPVPASVPEHKIPQAA